ncbi:hypothetical protein [Aurantimonas marina]|uniref:hypothetical protein n=1 Tax=Aurantimonas marina TaxID=2780508 RepID=UPI0019D1073F|nr:hypothetical protein [Aurantimonas marina]
MRDFEADDELDGGRRASDSIVEIRTGLFRATLLFGSIAMALALIVAPAAKRGADYVVSTAAPQLDRMATGSIGSSNRYTVRRSVLQRTGARPCVIFSDGGSTGAC